MYLFGKKIKGASIYHPLGKTSPKEILDDEEKMELIVKIKNGDLAARDKMILHHQRLAINIASQYAVAGIHRSHDLVSEAMLALVMGCDDVAKGKLHDDGVTGFLISKIHSYCNSYVRSDHLFGRKGRQAKQVSLHNNMTVKKVKDDNYSQPKTDYRDLKDLLDCSTVTYRQRTIMELKLQNNTIKQIAEILDLSESLVYREIQAVRENFRKLAKESA